jgi:hypothetical protein
LYTFVMSPLFGKKRSPSSIAVLDIESGSLGSGLVHISKTNSPTLLGQHRSLLRQRSAASSASHLLQNIEQEIETALIRLSEVSTNLKSHIQSEDIGRVAVFLHAPWTQVTFAERVKADTHDETLQRLRPKAEILGVPVTFHAFTTTTTPIVHGLFAHPEVALVISIGAEVSELSLLKSGGIVGYSTVPAGMNTVLRTLEAHAGVSRHEAHSILSLAKSARTHAWAEALASGVESLTRELHSGAASILSSSDTAQIFVISREPGVEIFARALSEHPSMQDLFEPGSVVRPLLSRTVASQLSGHPPRPDVALLLESLFVDSRFGA